MQLKDYVKKNWDKMTIADMARACGVGESSVRRAGERLGFKPKGRVQTEVSPVEKFNKKQESDVIKKQLNELLKENAVLKKKTAVKDNITDYKEYKIPVKKSTNDHEATAFALASDWHLEQLVDRTKIIHDNEYNLDIAEQRATQFFQNLLKLLKKEQQHVQINTLVLWLGGDFITGNIHIENLKMCQLGPSQAICFARDLLVSGIQFLLDNTTVDIIIPYNHGNHARTTDKVWLSTEEDNSLEYILYDDVGNHFRGNKRVKMVPPRGSVAVVEVYGLKVFFAHGHHGLTYQGGVGGLYIPVRKYLSRKLASIRDFHMLCIGHFHQYIQDTQFVCNGSMIGYDQYADSKGYAPEIPKQTFFLIDSKRKCRTVTTPITFDV